MGKDIVSAQFNFQPDELAYIANNYIHLDHEQAWSGSAGAAYTFNRTTDHPTRFSVGCHPADRAAREHATIPNGTQTPTYGVVNCRWCRSCARGLNCGWTC